MTKENTALTCGIVGLILFFPIDLILGLIAIFMGNQLLSFNPDNGKALAAVIIGWVGIVWSVIATLVLLFV